MLTLNPTPPTHTLVYICVMRACRGTSEDWGNGCLHTLCNQAQTNTLSNPHAEPGSVGEGLTGSGGDATFSSPCLHPILATH